MCVPLPREARRPSHQDRLKAVPITIHLFVLPRLEFQLSSIIPPAKSLSCLQADPRPLAKNGARLSRSKSRKMSHVKSLCRNTLKSNYEIYNNFHSISYLRRKINEQELIDDLGIKIREFNTRKNAPATVAKFIQRKNSLLREQIIQKQREKSSQRPETARAVLEHSKKPSIGSSIPLTIHTTPRPQSSRVTLVTDRHLQGVRSENLLTIFQTLSTSRQRTEVFGETIGLNRIESHEKLFEPASIVFNSYGGDTFHRRTKTISRFNFEPMVALTDSTRTSTGQLSVRKLSTEETPVNIHMQNKLKSRPATAMKNIAYFTSHRHLSCKNANSHHKRITSQPDSVMAYF